MKIINRILKWLFWNRVYKCNHEWDGDVCNLITCATPLCSGTETRCKKCGVYKSECGCGYQDGLYHESDR